MNPVAIVLWLFLATVGFLVSGTLTGAMTGLAIGFALSLFADLFL